MIIYYYNPQPHSESAFGILISDADPGDQKSCRSMQMRMQICNTADNYLTCARRATDNISQVSLEELRTISQVSLEKL
jgi:hypothetical protein